MAEPGLVERQSVWRCDGCGTIRTERFVDWHLYESPSGWVTGSIFLSFRAPGVKDKIEAEVANKHLFHNLSCMLDFYRGENSPFKAWENLIFSILAERVSATCTEKEDA